MPEEDMMTNAQGGGETPATDTPTTSQTDAPPADNGQGADDMGTDDMDAGGMDAGGMNGGETGGDMEDGVFGLAPSELLDMNVLAEADHFYETMTMPLNESGVQSHALLALDMDTNTLTTIIYASGLEAGQPHAQHIHGFADGTDAVVPTIDVDADGDGFIELAEGATTYGPILLPLSTPPGGDVSGFPTAPDGTYYFAESYELPSSDLSADPELTLREIVIHGLSVEDGAGAGTMGEVNGEAGYVAVLPASAGEISEISAAEAFDLFAELSVPALADSRIESLLAFDDAYRSELFDFRRNSVEDFRDTVNQLAEDYDGSNASQMEFMDGIGSAQDMLLADLEGIGDVSLTPGIDTFLA